MDQPLNQPTDFSKSLRDLGGRGMEHTIPTELQTAIANILGGAAHHALRIAFDPSHNERAGLEWLIAHDVLTQQQYAALGELLLSLQKSNRLPKGDTSEQNPLLRKIC